MDFFLVIEKSYQHERTGVGLYGGKEERKDVSLIYINNLNPTLWLKIPMPNVKFWIRLEYSYTVPICCLAYDTSLNNIEVAGHNYRHGQPLILRSSDRPQSRAFSATHVLTV